MQFSKFVRDVCLYVCLNREFLFENLEALYRPRPCMYVKVRSVLLCTESHREKSAYAHSAHGEESTSKT